MVEVGGRAQANAAATSPSTLGSAPDHPHMVVFAQGTYTGTHVHKKHQEHTQSRILPLDAAQETHLAADGARVSTHHSVTRAVATHPGAKRSTLQMAQILQLLTSVYIYKKMINKSAKSQDCGTSQRTCEHSSNTKCVFITVGTNKKITEQSIQSITLRQWCRASPSGHP